MDDHLYSHPKWLALPKGSRALWVTAGAWCAAQLLDGFVPTTALPILDGSKAEADRLVASGLWDATDEGYQFHDWSEYQPTKEAVMARRSKEAERLRRWREQRGKERGE